jgi:hypothetical protein
MDKTNPEYRTLPNLYCALPEFHEGSLVACTGDRLLLINNGREYIPYPVDRPLDLNTIRVEVVVNNDDKPIVLLLERAERRFENLLSMTMLNGREMQMWKVLGKNKIRWMGFSDTIFERYEVVK